MPWKVLWHPDAKAERDAIADANEKVAIRQATDQLRVNGPALRAPHQKAIQGPEGKGLRELRPTGGKSPSRPIYRQVGEDTFAILAVGPEAERDQGGFDRAVRRAQRRRAELEKKR